MLARLGAMFERTSSVRGERDLQLVLEDVCRTIGELLGYGAVVVNVYRPAFDDMLTAAAVGPSESIQQLVGRASPADTWYPLLAPQFERRGAYFVPGEEFDWDGSGVETYIPDIAPNDDPEAWRAEDALFVPLRDSTGELIGVVSVDEPHTGRRPSDEELDALVAIAGHAALALRIAQDTANDAQHQRMLESVLEVSARLAEAEARTTCSGGLRRHPGRARLRQGRIELAEEPGSALAPVAGSGGELGDETVGHGMTLEASATLHDGVRGRGLLPDPDRGRRGAPRRAPRAPPLRDERSRAARLVAPLAARAPRGTRRGAARADLGGRSA